MRSRRRVERVVVGTAELRRTAGRSALALARACSASPSALSQPQCGTHTELTKRTGIDVVVALDASRSMQAQDIRPSRLERAKLELSDLLDRLRGDRIGIVVFAADAFRAVPAHHRLRRRQALPQGHRPRFGAPAGDLALGGAA